jgi:outer membrane protein TolC
MRAIAAAGLLLLAPWTWAQQVSGSFYGGVPQGTPAEGVLDLTLSDTLRRGLDHNLGLLLAERGAEGAEGTRWKALADLLPNFGGTASFTRQKLNLAVFGISIPGFPTLVGPFNVYDFRVGVRSQVLNLKDLHTLHAESENKDAAQLRAKDARGLVILVCGGLYLDAVAAESRIQEARAQRETAKSLFDLATDRKKAGAAPGIDVLRSEVELRSRDQQLIVAENAFAKAKLNLARAIGLPAGQEFRLVDQVPYQELPGVGVEGALSRAYRDRSDWAAAQAQVRSAQESLSAARSEYVPTVDVEADIGQIGQTTDTLKTTYTLVGALRVPIWEGGKTHGKVIEATARLDSQRAVVEDLRAQIDLEVRAALLDVKATEERVHVAEEASRLAKEQLQEAQDRFANGVTGNLDVVQAQEAVAVSAENRIASLYEFNLAKATLAHAVGAAESAYGEVRKGE